jgi:hypothetical protein
VIASSTPSGAAKDSVTLTKVGSEAFGEYPKTAPLESPVTTVWLGPGDEPFGSASTRMQDPAVQL